MRDPSKDRSWAEWEVKVLFNKLDSAGLVIKVDRELPKDELAEMVIRQTEIIGLPKTKHPYYQAQKDMLKAGYVAVKPLMDDKVQRIREANFR